MKPFPSCSSQGGLLILSEEKCPWKIDFEDSPVFYYDRRKHNIWNEGGNGWKEDRSVGIECYDADKDPVYECGCKALNVSSSGAVGAVHADKIGAETYCIIAQINGAIRGLQI